MLNEHDWKFKAHYDECLGFECSKCNLFVKYNSTRPMHGCTKMSYDEVIDCSGGCVVSIKYHNTNPIDNCEGDKSSYSTMSQQDFRRELSGTEFWNEDKGDRA